MVPVVITLGLVNLLIILLKELHYICCCFLKFYAFSNVLFFVFNFSSSGQAMLLHYGYYVPYLYCHVATCVNVMSESSLLIVRIKNMGSTIKDITYRSLYIFCNAYVCDFSFPC